VVAAGDAVPQEILDLCANAGPFVKLEEQVFQFDKIVGRIGYDVVAARNIVDQEFECFFRIGPAGPTASITFSKKRDKE
jgi:hypothetical protein